MTTYPVLEDVGLPEWLTEALRKDPNAAFMASVIAAAAKEAKAHALLGQVRGEIAGILSQVHGQLGPEFAADQEPYRRLKAMLQRVAAVMATACSGDLEKTDEGSEDVCSELRPGAGEGPGDAPASECEPEAVESVPGEAHF